MKETLVIPKESYISETSKFHVTYESSFKDSPKGYWR